MGRNYPTAKHRKLWEEELALLPKAKPAVKRIGEFELQARAIARSTGRAIKKVRRQLRTELNVRSAA
jgi:hypothetical protein